ncbi:MAG: hypothetical protein GY904_12290, partial [Planctomycetaceae bacterium]|nr:hypothetical protein [Planctomycetaceae bacterium]
AGSTGVGVSVGLTLAFNEVDNDIDAYIKDVSSVSSAGDIRIDAHAPAGDVDPPNYLTSDGTRVLSVGDTVRLDETYLNGGQGGRIYKYRGFVPDYTLEGGAGFTGDLLIRDGNTVAKNGNVYRYLAVNPDNAEREIDLSTIDFETNSDWTVFNGDSRNLGEQDYSDTRLWELADGTITARAAAASISAAFGATAGVAISGAGANSVNTVLTRTNAFIDDSTVTSAADVNLNASKRSIITAQVGAVSVALGGGGAAGVGASIGVSVVSNLIGWKGGSSVDSSSDPLSEVQAYINNSTLNLSGDLTLDADNHAKIDALSLAGSAALGVGGSIGGGASGAGVLTENQISVAVKAYIDGTDDDTDGSDPSDTITAGSVSLSADDAASIFANAAAVSIAAGFGGAAGLALSVGITLADNYVRNDVAAFTANTNSVTSSVGDIKISATENAEIDSLAAAASAAIAGGGAAGVALSGAGGSARNIILTTTKAFVESSTLSSARKLDIDTVSTANVDAIVAAASAAIGLGGTAGIGASVGVALARNYIGFDPTAATDHDATTEAPLKILTPGDRIKVAGGARNREIYQYIGDNPVTRYDLLFDPSSGSQSVNDGNSVAVPFDYEDGGAGGIYEAKGNRTVASDEDFTDTDHWEFLGTNEIDFGDTEQWSQILTDSATEVKAYLLDANITAATAVTLDAVGNETVNATTIAGSAAVGGGGLAGIGLSGAGVATENRIKNSIQAFIDGVATKNTLSAGSLALNASDTSTITTEAAAVSLAGAVGGLAGIAVGIGVSIAFNQVDNHVDAYINKMDVTTTTGSIALNANQNATIQATSAAAALAASGGLVGISIAGAGAAAKNIINTQTEAYVSSSDLTSAGNVTVNAVSTANIDASIISAAASFAIGAVGIGASIGAAEATNIIGETPNASKVAAYIQSSSVNAGGNLSVHADSSESINANVAAISVAIAGGVVAGGVAGSGAKARNVIDSNIHASISNASSTGINAGGDVSVRAQDNADIDSYVGAASVAGSAGLIGGSFSISVSLSENIITNSITAWITESDVSAGNVSVIADDTSEVDAFSEAAALSASLSLGFSVSGSGADATVTGTNTVYAYVTGTGSNDLFNLTGDLTVSATSSADYFGQTGVSSVSVGLISLAASGGTVTVSLQPDVDAYVAGVNVTANEIDIDAIGRISAEGFAYGMSVSSGLSMGSNTVTVTTNADLDGYLGSGTFNVRGLQVTSLASQDPGKSYTGKATSYSSAGGLLLGATSTSSTTSNSNTVNARVLAGANINATGTVDVSASNSTQQIAEGSAAALGLIGAGAALADAFSNTTVLAVVSSTDLDANNLNITAADVSANFADTSAGSGGLVSGSAAAPTTTTTADVKAQIDSNAHVNLTGDRGSLSISAGHEALPNTRVRTESLGLIGGTGAAATNSVTSDVLTKIGDSSTVLAKNILLGATNQLDKLAVSGTNIDGDAGGLASGALASSDISVDFETIIEFGNSANVSVTDRNGEFIAVAFNDLKAADEVALFTAGALSGAGAFTELNTVNNLAEIRIGNGATVTSEGDIEFEAQGATDILLSSKSETYGVGTVALGHALIEVRPVNRIDVRGDATLRAGGDLFLSTGTDKDLTIAEHSLEARVDNFAGSLIPIDELRTRAVYLVQNIIEVGTGATVESYQDIDLNADAIGLASVIGEAKATNWASQVGDAIDSLLGGNNETFGKGEGLADANSRVINNGTIRTGAKRVKELILDEIDPVTGIVSNSTPSDISYTVANSTVQSTQEKAIDSAVANLARYRVDKDPTDGNPTDWVNPDLVKFYEDEIARLEQDMIDLGLGVRLTNLNFDNQTTDFQAGTTITGESSGATAIIRTITKEGTSNAGVLALVAVSGNFQNNEVLRDSSGGVALANGVLSKSEIFPLSPDVITVTIEPTTAQAGRVRVLTDQLGGSGQIDSPKDALLRITNQTQAFLIIEGLEIPEVNGGLFFNGIEVTVASDPNGVITTENQANVTKDNDQKIEPAVTLITPSLTFTAESLAASGGIPSIAVENTKDVTKKADGETLVDIPPWPDITINGPVLNLRGDLDIINRPVSFARGDIVINAEVNAKNPRIISGGSIFIDLAGDDTAYHVGGDPYSKWLSPDLTSNGLGNAAIDGGTNIDADDDITDFLEVEPDFTPGGFLEGSRVTVRAEYINVNGIIQSGKADYHLTLDAAVAKQINRIREEGGQAVTNLQTSNDDFLVQYDRIRNQVVVQELSPSGGYVDLEGHIMNTRNGKIIVSSGYPDIDIINNMTFASGQDVELVIKRIDASTRGTGKLIIKDKAKGMTSGFIETFVWDEDLQDFVSNQVPATVPYTTIYTVQPDGTVNVSENGVAIPGSSSRSFVYEPKDGFRYGWAVGQSTVEEIIREYTLSDWLGIDAFVPDNHAPDKTDVTPLGDPRLIENSNYFFQGDPGPGELERYTFDSFTSTDYSREERTGYESESTWYGTNHYWYQYTKVQGQTTTASHTIESDRDIDINFIGHAEGSININAGTADVIVEGGIENASGDTTILTGGSISTTSSSDASATGSIGGRLVTLSAGGTLGSEGRPLRTDLSNSQTPTRLDATTTNGEIYIQEVNGDLAIGRITAGSGQNVTLTTNQSIRRASTGASSLISGGAISLYAEGDIGSAAESSTILIDTGINEGDLLLATSTIGGVHVKEATKDLTIDQIQAAGDVTIFVASGDLLDGNTVEQADERAIEALRNNVWGDLQLTGAAAHDKVNNTKNSLANTKTTQYQTYWEWRDRQTDHLIFRQGEANYNPDALLELGADEQSFYETFYTDTSGNVDHAAIEALRISRTEQYKNLDATYGIDGGSDGNPDTFDSDYTVALTAEEISEIEASIKIWTEAELINGIGIGLLKPVTDTDTVNELPNIVATNVSLHVPGGGVGRTGGQILIDLSYDLTDDDRVILGAAERDDVFYLTTNRVEASVDFDAPTDTLTRRDGNWGSEFFAGQIIQVEGGSANATEDGPFYRILSVSGNVITLDTSEERTQLEANEVNERVFVSGIALDPRGATVGATVNVSNGNTITFVSGTKGFGAFTTGMKLLLAGNSQNINDADNLYEILSASETEIVLKGSPNLTNESNVAITLDQYVDLVAVQVQLREDLDMELSGNINISAGGDTFIGTTDDTDAILNQLNIAGDLRIKSSESIVNNAGASATNIVSNHLLLEAGSGSVGGIGDANRIYLDVNPGFNVTARAVGDIVITERNGDINVGTMFSQTSDVDLIAEGSILDGINESFVNIEADDIRLDAGGSIGATGNALDIEARGDGSAIGSGLLTATSNGDIYLIETIGDMNVRNVLSRNGNVALTANLSILDAFDLTDPTDPSSSEDTASTGKPRADILGDSITLVATIGQIGQAGNELDIDSRRLGTGVLNSSSSDNTYLIETSGNLYIDQTGTNGETAFITAPTSGILNGAAADVSNVSGGRAFLVANTNIGTTLKPLFTRIGTIQSISTTGSTYVTNDGPLLVDVISSGIGQSSAGDLTVISSSPITIVADVIADGDIVYNATDLADEDYDTITVNPDIRVDSGAGNVVFNAGDDIVISSGAVVEAAGDIEFNTDVGNLDTGGGDITINGSINAISGNLTMTSGPDDDTISIHGSVTSGSTATISTGAGTDVVNVSSSGSLTGGNVLIESGDDQNTITIDGSVNADAGYLAINSGSDNDEVNIHGSATSVGTATISTGSGGDTVNISSAGSLTAGNVLIQSGDDTDTITIFGTIDAGLNTIVIDGGAGTDSVLLETPTLTGEASVLGGDDEDSIVVDQLPSQAAGDSLRLDGGGNTDVYTINIAGGATDYVIDVDDSGAENDGADTLTINGLDTPSTGDVFLLRKNFVAKLDGTFVSPDVGQPATYNQNSSTAERINYNATINGRMRLNTLAGDDYVASDDNSALTTIDGGEGADTFQIGQVFASERNEGTFGIAAGDGVETTQVLFGFLADETPVPVELSRGISLATVIYGGNGDDKFAVYSNKAQLKLFGEADDDEFVVRAFALFDVDINTGAGADVVEYNINAPVSIDGGSGIDTVVAIGTPLADNFVITETGIFGAGLAISYENIEIAEVDGLEGDDNFYVLSTNEDIVTTIIGGLGSDTINVGGDVTGRIVAQSVEGQSGFINHAVESLDPGFNGIFADGISLNIANRETAKVVVKEFSAAGITPVNTNSDLEDGQTVVREDSAGSLDRYTVSMSEFLDHAINPTIAYVTVSATRSSSSDRKLERRTLDASELSAGEIDQPAESVEISTDGNNWFSSLVLTFDTATNWDDAQTIFVRAASDSAIEGERTVVINHSVLSDNPEYNQLDIPNVEVQVIDDDQADLIIIESENRTRVEENGPSDTYKVALTRPPASGEVVMVTLTPDEGKPIPQLEVSPTVLAFTSASWNTPQVVTVSAINDTIAENTLRTEISHSISSSLGAASEFANTSDVGVKVKVLDDDAKSIVVKETGGSTFVVEGRSDDEYTLKLTAQPTLPDGVTPTTVTVKILSDGQTAVSSTDPRFVADTGDGIPGVVFDGNVDGDGFDWNDPITIVVTALAIVVPDQPVQTFPAQPHTVNSIHGPLIVNGGVIPGKDRSLATPLMLPTETDAPRPDIAVFDNESEQTDTLNIYNDDSAFNGADNAAFVGTLTADRLSGLEMGGDLTLEAGTPDEKKFAGGITYDQFEVIDILLGNGNDIFNIEGTADDAITVVHGGGGSDTITVNGSNDTGTGALVLLGDSVQDGSRYSVTTDAISANAREFSNPAGDTIDASGADAGVTIYGGQGDDDITGSQYGDHLAGGSGSDKILGLGGGDHIYGDSGFNLDLSTQLGLASSLDPVKQVLTVAVAAGLGDNLETSDDLTAGTDEIDAGAGSDVILADHGIIAQTQPTQRISTTSNVALVATRREENGLPDSIDGGADNDLILGGGGGDTIVDLLGNNIILGDHGTIDYVSDDADHSDIDFITSTSTTNFGGIDDIKSGEGNDIIIGGRFGDIINVLGGDNLIIGDSGRVTGITTGTPQMGDPMALGLIETIAFTDGDDDDIVVGSGKDVILGGYGTDYINVDRTTGALIGTDTGADVILGDNGFARFDSINGFNILREARTSAAGTGDVDVIYAAEGFDVVLGGDGGDRIDAGLGAERDVVVGDNGYALFDATEVLLDIRTTNPSVGGDDDILVGDGDDFVLGGFGSDYINVDRTTGNAIGDDSGKDIFIGDNGYAIFDAVGGKSLVRQIHTTELNIGDRDVIFASNGSDIVLGGVGGDDIDAGTDASRDIIVGDNGFAKFDSQEVLIEIRTTDTTNSDRGNDDNIVDGDGDDVVLGGVGSDYINVDRNTGTSIVNDFGEDVILGDNGYALFDSVGGKSLILEIHTTEPDLGDRDVIFASNGFDVVLGGTGGDDIDAGIDDSRDIVLGDNGEVHFAAGTNELLELIRSTSPELGGDDNITVGDGNDVVIAGNGADYINWDSSGTLSEPRIGEDTGKDVIIGDSGEAIFKI